MTTVSHLVRLVGVYLLYSLITVNNGERGPVVTLIQDPDRKAYTPPIAVDLSDEAEEAGAQLSARQGESLRMDDLTGVRLPRNGNPVPNRVERHLGNDVLRHQLPLNPVGPILDHFISYFSRQA